MTTLFPKRSLPLAALLILSSALGACRDEPAKPAKPAKPAAKAPADEAPAAAAEAPIDVSFLVEPCVASGIDADKCKCGGQEAKKIIGRELLAKMAKAPETDVDEYYSYVEMTTIMSWVKDGAKTCGVEGGA